MSLIGVFSYYILLTGIGYFFIGRKNVSRFNCLLISFLLGSLLSGNYFFLVGQLSFLNSSSIWFFITVGVFLTFFARLPFKNYTIQSINYFKNLLQEKKAFSCLLLYVCLLILGWYIILCFLPPRSADAMRYHLAQMKDILWNKGFEFRPYYHYNFPMHFHMTFIPMFYFFKGVGMQFAVLGHFIASLLLTLRIAVNLKIRNLWILIFLFLLTPISYWEATIVTNDWVVIFYILCGLHFFLDINIRNNWLFSLYAFASLGLALATKYQAILMFPWFLVLGWFNLKNIYPTKKAILFLFLCVICMSIVMSPCYLRNYYHTGSPFWPLLQDLFHCNKDYLYLVTKKYGDGMSGVHSLKGILTVLINAFKNPLIPFSIWILGITGVFYNARNSLKFGLGFITFFLLWWVVEPTMYWRFSIYIMPVAFLSGAILFDSLKVKNKSFLLNIYKMILFITLCYGAAMGVMYTKDYVPYYVNKNLKNYHEHTWYYEEYDWINKNISQKDKFLVIVGSGQTYYLNRTYLRADPLLSGLIKWPSYKNLEQLIGVLRKLEINYIFYDNRDWSEFAGGANMMRLIEELKNSPYSIIIRNKEIKLTHSRIQNLYTTSEVILLKLKYPPM